MEQAVLQDLLEQVELQVVQDLLALQEHLVLPVLQE